MPVVARARAKLVSIGPPRELVGLVRWAALAVVLLVAGRLNLRPRRVDGVATG